MKRFLPFFFTLITAPAVIFSMALPVPRPKIGHVGLQGHRPTMEDYHYAHKFGPNEFKTNVPVSFIGAIFDGHGGAQGAEYLQQNLVNELEKNIGTLEKSTSDTNIIAEIKKSFENIDMYYLSEVIKNKWTHVGSCAAVVMIIGNKIFAANLGDSRIVIGTESTTYKDLSVDHKPDNSTEKKRIYKAGGYIEQKEDDVYRVAGRLAISRAFGHPQLKMPGIKKRYPAAFSANADWISCIPDVQVHEIKDHDAFLIIACDGVWDVMESQDAVDFVSEKFDEEYSAKQAAEFLAKEALKRGSTDNISVLIYRF